MPADGAEFRILTVCLGNVCRSPLMELLLRDRVPAGVSVSSAGLIAREGDPMEEYAAAELARLGGSAEGFAARPFRGQLAKEADLVLTATSAIKSRVLEEQPGALRRTFTLLELAHLVQQAPSCDSPEELVAWSAANRSLAANELRDVVDPMGERTEVHRQAADLVDDATQRIAEALTALSSRSGVPPVEAAAGGDAGP